MTCVRTILVISVTLTLLTACRTTPQGIRSTRSSKTKRTLVAEIEALCGGPGVCRLFQVGSNGPVADRSFIQHCRTYGPSRMAKQVSPVVGEAEHRRTFVAFYGPNSAKTARVAIDAINMNSDKDLSRLVFLFCGEKSDLERVRAEVKSFEGDLRFVKYP